MRTPLRKSRKPRGDGRRRLRLPGGIEHQQHRPAHHRGEIGAGAGAGIARRRDAVEQAHRSLGQHEVGIAAARRRAHRCVSRVIAQLSRLTEARPVAAA